MKCVNQNFNPFIAFFPKQILYRRQSELSVTYSIVQSPSWAANWFVASQEIPRISRNPKVHYRTQKRPPPVSILGHPNPVHITFTSEYEVLIPIAVLSE